MTKYNYKDIVEFKIGTHDALIGEIKIIDKGGAFGILDGQDSYDIMVNEMGNPACLYKHIPESNIIRLVD